MRRLMICQEILSQVLRGKVDLSRLFEELVRAYPRHMAVSAGLTPNIRKSHAVQFWVESMLIPGKVLDGQKAESIAFMVRKWPKEVDVCMRTISTPPPLSVSVGEPVLNQFIAQWSTVSLSTTDWDRLRSIKISCGEDSSKALSLLQVEIQKLLGVDYTVTFNICEGLLPKL